MSLGEALQALTIVVPILLAILVAAVKMSTRLALIDQRQQDHTKDIEELRRRQSRHERDPVHLRLRR